MAYGGCVYPCTHSTVRPPVVLPCSACARHPLILIRHGLSRSPSRSARLRPPHPFSLPSPRTFPAHVSSSLPVRRMHCLTWFCISLSFVSQDFRLCHLSCRLSQAQSRADYRCGFPSVSLDLMLSWLIGIIFRPRYHWSRWVLPYRIAPRKGL